MMKPGTWVEVHWQGAPQATRMQLADVQRLMGVGRLPHAAMVRTAPDAPWRPALEVVAECPELGPTRTWAAAALVAALPVVILVVHVVVFRWAGVLGPLALMVIGGIAAVVLVSAPSIRTRSSSALFNNRVFGVSAVLTVTLVEGLGFVFGLADSSAHQRISAALTSSNPCDIEKVDGDLDKYGSDVEKTEALGAHARCSDQRAAELCDRLAKQVDNGKLDPVDEAAERTRSQATVDTLDRIVAGKLDESDLSATNSYACPQTLHQLAKAAAASPQVWTNATTVSDDMTKELKLVGLSAASKAALADRADVLAKASATKKTSADLAPSKAMCDLARGLDAGSRPSCDLVAKRYASLTTSEKSARDANDARSAQQNDAAQKRSSAGFVSCMTQCNRSRSADDREADSACVEGCGGDFTCAAKCHHASSCELSCAAQYPDALNSY